MKYYVDVRKQQLIEESDITPYMAPETYYEYCSSDNNMFIETWICEDKSLLLVHYAEDEYKCAAKIRKDVFNKSKSNPINLKKFSVPSDHFCNALIAHYFL